MSLFLLCLFGITILLAMLASRRGWNHTPFILLGAVILLVLFVMDASFRVDISVMTLLCGVLLLEWILDFIKARILKRWNKED